MNEISPSNHNPRLICLIFGLSIPLGLLLSYFLLPKIVEWTQSEELTVIVSFVPMLIGITSVLALMILRWKARRPLPLFLYAVGGFGAPALYFGCFFVSAILVIPILGPTEGLGDIRNWIVIGLAWAITILTLMDFVLWVTRSNQS